MEKFVRVPPFMLPVGVLLLVTLSGLSRDSLAQVPDTVQFEEEIVYGTVGEEELTLNLARPQQANGEKLPCVLVIHGGAWRSGNKRVHNNITWEFAKRGYVAATVGYRLCPQHIFPAQVQDVKCAARYLRAHAEKYGLDPTRFGAVGFSAGAHLAMMLGVMNGDDGLDESGGWTDQDSQVQAVVAFFGPTELGADDIPQRSVPLVRDFLGGSKEEKADAYKNASPISYVTSDDATMLLFQGTKDPLVPHTQAFKMIEALTKAGISGRAELLIGAGHGWGGEDLERTISETYRFFEVNLK